jgi:DNA-binding MarR family transcriptional regulator
VKQASKHPGDLISAVEHEFGMFMMNIVRYKHQVGGDRLDRMALMVLGTLSHCGPSRLSTVAERTGFDASTVSRQVADLEKANLLAREADPDDKRAVLLQATPEGMQMMARLAAGRRKRLERLLDDWTDNDIADLGRLLGRLNEATQKYGEQNRLEMDEELNNG